MVNNLHLPVPDVIHNIVIIIKNKLSKKSMGICVPVHYKLCIYVKVEAIQTEIMTHGPVEGIYTGVPASRGIKL